MPLPYSSSSTSSTRLLYRVNSWGVVFIALSWWVLITTWSSRCERKSTPCRAHRLIATCDKNQPENRDWWSKILKKRQSWRGEVVLPFLLFFSPFVFAVHHVAHWWPNNNNSARRHFPFTHFPFPWDVLTNTDTSLQCHQQLLPHNPRNKKGEEGWGYSRVGTARDVFSESVSEKLKD